MRKNAIKGLACLLFILLPAFTLLADSPNPPNPGGDPTGGGNPPVGAPIDGGLGILLAIGAAYGGRKLYKAKKRQNPEVCIE